MTKSGFRKTVRIYIIAGLILTALGCWFNKVSSTSSLMYFGGMFIGQGAVMIRFKDKIIDEDKDDNQNNFTSGNPSCA